MLTKEGYKPAINGTAVIRTDVDSNGFIITDSDTQVAAGMKAIRITRANAENNAQENFTVINTLLGLTGAQGIASENQFTVRWEV